MAVKKKVPGESIPLRSRGGMPDADGLAPAKPSEAKLQRATYEQAVHHFHARDFLVARKLFEVASNGPALEVAHNAKLHIRMCERRLEHPATVPITPEDHYNFGVERMNARDLQSARKHLEIARNLSPTNDHVLYTLAACCALSGDADGACSYLRQAIDVNPRNRVAARQDPDFTQVHDAMLSALLFPERMSPF